MKLKIDKKKIKKHIENISRGIVTYSHLPALQGVLVEVKESSITLITSDGLLSMKEVIAKNDQMLIEETGKILVPGKLFKDIIDKAGDTIEINVKNSKMTINSEDFMTEINLLDVEEYPNISFETVGKELIVDADEFKDMIKNVAFAAAVDNKKVILNGVNIKVVNKELKICATNSFRLAQEIKKIDSSIEFDITIIAKKIKDFIPYNTKDKLIINVDENKIISNVGSTTISSKLIDDDYLPIEKLISTEFSTRIVLEARDVEKSVDRVTLVSKEGKKRVELIANKNELIFKSEKSEVGEAKSNIKDFEINGDDIKIVFDYSFLKEAISKYNGKIVMAFNGPHKPFIIRGESNKNLIQLIMPHKVH